MTKVAPAFVGGELAVPRVFVADVIEDGVENDPHIAAFEFGDEFLQRGFAGAGLLVAPGRLAGGEHIHPAGAVALGAAVAGEAITVRMLVAGAAIIAAVVLIISQPPAPLSEPV
ncbi:MAG: hypothetical protein WCS70_16265 [Verrucomicrobiota bacterium]